MSKLDHLTPTLSYIYDNLKDAANAFIDPKTVLCAYYKAGTCEKGNKCKFSHDLNIARKVEKKDLYSDAREDKENGESLLIPKRRLRVY
jgi:hypothetical protein